MTHKNNSTPVVRKDDLGELKRMATNLYHEDKACMLRVISAIAELEAENGRLRRELVAKNE